jgi:hypothetical protein
MKLRRFVSCASFIVTAALFASSCGSSPTQPPAPPPPPPPANELAVIDSVTASAERVEVDSDVTFTASVRDAETPVAQLRFDWKADVGTFSGTGPTVTWRLPKGATTPVDVVVTLTVVETYGVPDAAGRRPEQSVSATAPAVRVHDSAKEIGDLSMAFLRDFANSAVSGDSAVREFTDSCRGKFDERDQIENNRRDYQITQSSLALERAAVSSNRLSGDARVACEFWSVIKQCQPGVSCTVGGTEHVRGKCDLTAVYEQKRWWLCSSAFNEAELLPSMRSFIRIGRAHD